MNRETFLRIVAGLTWLGLAAPFSSAHAQVASVPEVKEERRFDGHTSYVNRVVFAPDGKTALSSGFDQTVRRWNLETGKQTDVYQVTFVNDMAVFSDGNTALFGRGQSMGTQRITLWNLNKGADIATWKAHEMCVYRICLVPKSNMGVTASLDGTVIVWDLASGKQIYEFVAWRQGIADGLPPEIDRQAGNVVVAAAADGKTLATGTGRNKMIALWNLSTGEAVMSWPSNHGEVSSIQFSPDGKYLLTGTINHHEPGAQLWEVKSGKLVREWLIGPLWQATFSPDGKRFLTADVKSEVRLWDIEAQIPLRRFIGHEGWVTSVAFSPDGQTALSSGNDKTVRMWQMPK